MAYSSLLPPDPDGAHPLLPGSRGQTGAGSGYNREDRVWEGLQIWPGWELPPYPIPLPTMLTHALAIVPY